MCFSLFSSAMESRTFGNILGHFDNYRHFPETLLDTLENLQNILGHFDIFQRTFGTLLLIQGNLCDLYSNDTYFLYTFWDTSIHHVNYFPYTMILFYTELFKKNLCVFLNVFYNIIRNYIYY